MTSLGKCLLLLMTFIIIKESSGNILITNPLGGPSQGPPQSQRQPVYQPQPGTQQFQQQPTVGSNSGYCVGTGTGCTNPDACCSKACRSAAGKHSRVCCLPEGALCETDTKGSPGLSTCCAGTMCMPMAPDQFGVGNQGILVCQTMPQSG